MIGPAAIKVSAEVAPSLTVVPNSYLDEVQFVLNRLGGFSGIRVSIECDHFMKWHYGMGFHTQLRLSLAAAIALLNHQQIEIQTLAQKIHRGGTSGIGVNGFWTGGVLFDGGQKRVEEDSKCEPSSTVSAPKPSPILFSRTTLPFQPVIVHARDWHLVHGDQERSLFGSFAPISNEQADRVARIMFQDLMSSAATEDYDGFCQALEELQLVGFKRRELEFRGKAANRIGEVLRGAGLRGVGMSSWGPTWFGFAKDTTSADEVVADLLQSPLIETAWHSHFAPAAQLQLDDGPVRPISVALQCNDVSRFESMRPVGSAQPLNRNR